MEMSNKNLVYQIEQRIVFKYSNPVPSWRLPIIWHLLKFWIMKRFYLKKGDHTHFPSKTLPRAYERRQNERKKGKKESNIFKVSDDDTSSRQIPAQSYKQKY